MSNRAILWDHFIDVVCLLLMEAAVAALASGLERIVPQLHSFVQIADRILIWFAIFTVSQFAVCSFVLLVVRNLRELRKAYHQLRPGAQ